MTWQPISTAPKDCFGTPILAIQDGVDLRGLPQNPMVVCYNGGWFGLHTPNSGWDAWPLDYDMAPDGHRFTNWMPLPSPPTTEGE